MKKDGFTLMELLVVIVILVVTSVSSTIIFESASSGTEEEDLKRLYSSVQRSAQVYLDLNDSWMNSFNENKEVFLKVSELENANYYNATYEGVKTRNKISPSYFVKLFINKNNLKEYVDSCLIEYDKNDRPVCVADKDGNHDGCDYNTNCVAK